jgi:hypothetical protein
MKTISPLSIVMSFGGFDIAGWAPDTMLTVAFSEDQVTEVVGADGEVCRVLNPNELGTATFTLSQASLTNDKLSALAIVDRATGKGVKPLLIKDLFGTSLYKAEEAWIVKIPDAAHGKDHQTREWAIRCAKLKMFVGGSLTPTAF